MRVTRLFDNRMSFNIVQIVEFQFTRLVKLTVTFKYRGFKHEYKSERTF